MKTIRSVHAREILDSRGFPTLEVEVLLENSILGRASVPSGASTGAFEALEKRDGDAGRYRGKGVLSLVESIDTEIHTLLQGQEADQQARIDALLCALDGTENKSRLGANAILGVSLATARAAAAAYGLPLWRYLGAGLGMPCLPVPMMNLVNGGAHASNGLDFQEFMIIPHGFGSFSRALQAGTEVFYALKAALQEAGHQTHVGDEGGFAPELASHREGLDFLLTACRRAGYEPGSQISFALDCAASGFYRDGAYHLAHEGKTLSTEAMVAYLVELTRDYPIRSIEDGLAEEDWEGWQVLTHQIGENVQIVGDDLFTTHPRRLARGIESGAGNAILVKLNQIGTLTETLQTVRLARSRGFATVISHRSGETEDSFIADLAVATEAGQIKCGAPCRSDRTAKYNQVLRIEDELGDLAVYGSDPLAAAESFHQLYKEQGPGGN